jgi:hypothetical protein
VLSLIVKEGNRAGEVVGRIRALIKKAPARKDAVEINDAILEVIALTRTEAANNSVSVRTRLAEGLPRVEGDRIQLQQVLLNLIINAVEAMRDVDEEEREFASARVANRLACQSRCEIQVLASRRRLLSACSRRSTPRNRAVWGLDCRSAGRSSKRITDNCGRALTCHVALSLASLRRLIRRPHREWNAASDPRRGRGRRCKARDEPRFTASMKKHSDSSGDSPIQYDGKY